MTRAWSEAAIPGLTGITAVVTEASGGIGLQVTRGLGQTLPAAAYQETAPPALHRLPDPGQQVRPAPCPGVMGSGRAALATLPQPELPTLRRRRRGAG